MEYVTSQNVKKWLSDSFRRDQEPKKISVTKGKGTACGWIYASIEAHKSPMCDCDTRFGTGINRNPGYCESCKGQRQTIDERVHATIRAMTKLHNLKMGQFLSDDGYNNNYLDEFILRVELV